MEGNLIELDKVEHTFLTDIFEEVCPYYLTIGMTYDQFWRDDPTIVKYYKKAYTNIQEISKWNNWEQGMYTYEALCKVSPVLHAFAKNGTKPLPFSTEPYGIKELRKEKENKKNNKIEEQQKVENERLKAQIFFNNWYRATSEHFKGKEVENK